MRIKQIQVRNFRLLDNFSVNIEDDITLIVGKNNTGKTSLFEAINVFTKASQEISFEDFSLSSYLKFKKIANFINRIDFSSISEKRKEIFEKIIQNQTPKVQLFIEFEYDIEKDSLINLSEFITDLNEKRNDATVLISFEPLNSLGLFSGFLNREKTEIGLISWLKENLKKYYHLTCYAVEKDSDFKRDIGLNFKSKIEKIVSFEDIKASRTLDDTKSDKNKTLATGFSHYYRERDKTKKDVKKLEDTLTKVSVDLKNEYEKVLKDVIHDLNHFGASTPISIPKIEIDSEFNSESVIKNNIKYYYKHNDINLPESYNGLGYSNLIFMVLELTSFIEKFKNSSEEKKSEFLTILIEEPEAHMHPQMQQVFIKQITNKINDAKSNGINIQLIITTHSSHIIAEAGIDLKKGFDRIRYFNKINGTLEVNDFKNFKHKKSNPETFRFLKQYLNLHKCDIFFADKVIMVEGITEKMLLPLMINKIAPELNKMYISILEVGGAYTHKFKELLNFIKVKTLVITDIDSVHLDDNRKACRVNTSNSVTSNATLKNWLPKKNTIADLISTRLEEKFDGKFIRVSYQIAENTENQYIARSLEEAIINRNLNFFNSKYNDLDEDDKVVEVDVKSQFELLKKINFEEQLDLYELSPKKSEKSQFAFDLMTFKAGIDDLSWEVPHYIGEGLKWLEKMNKMTAIEQIIENIDNKKSFVLEAGAGSGKTYTLIQTLNYLLENKGEDLKYNHQKIVCITYTNVAKNEIIERLENNPLVIVSTIHEFLWDCIKSYEKQLKIELCKLNEIRYQIDIDSGIEESRYIPNLIDRLDKIDSVLYNDTAFRDFENGQLHHDDVIVLSKMMFCAYPLLTNILSQKFPYLLIDEYQDTAKETINALVDSLLENNKDKITLGFYGDSHQKIYNNGVGDLTNYINTDSQKLHLVKKEENYRSSIAVVNLLNKFRTNIEQKTQTDVGGSAKFIYCEYRPIKTRINKNKREVDDESRSAYNAEIDLQKKENFDKVVDLLVTRENWIFDKLDNKKNDKILVLVNSAVAKRNGFSNLYRIYSRRYTRSVGDELNKRRNALIQYFVGYTDKKISQERETGIEHLVKFWEECNYNEVLRFLKRYSSLFVEGYLEHKHKKIITDILDELIVIRKTKSVKEVMEFVESRKLIRRSDAVKKFIEQVGSDFDKLEDGPEKNRFVNNKILYDSLLGLSYKEIINFFEFTQNHTVFSTKHGTKGEEYRNVLTVIDDKEWVNEAEGYNFEGFFDNTDVNEERKLRTRNLFYVECSRAKENLIVLALSPIGELALNNIEKWFGKNNVIKLNNF